ncbi:SMP-30/gluconolactonase/LRE family protein [Hymenobacter cheonanensis]|uniref:SMP-30/gluconolactonase/LRE family protein n=1 Tax=Hymenobacter sp. CA2-7 TaxID=3063993 RepID=UPI00271261AF|nr:SMP-30/gluconolactonase/LRE family protein [Hymenobacter sp. CA2-7]MDO7883837.1 SMP-30/gluconolactonase/LRE family protein [Hymenobacter sp. CA2-7]
MRMTIFLFLGLAPGLGVGPAAAQAPPRYLTTGRIARQAPALDQVLAPGAQLEVVASGYSHIEGPLWVPDSSMLLFSDTPSQTIYRWKAAGGSSTFLKSSGYTGRLPYSKEPGSNGLALDERGNLLICEHGDRRLASLSLSKKSGKRTLTDNFEGKRYNSPNDVVRAPDGAIYFTDPPFGLPRQAQDPGRELPYTGVFRRAADGQLTAEVTDVPFANGLAFSPDGRTLYISNADSLRPLILAYEVGKNGRLSKPRPFFDMTRLPRARFKEVPDGLKVDQAGNVYAAGFGGLLIISPQGRLLATVDPGEVVSNCAWGDDGHSLYLMATTFVCRLRTLAPGVPGK